METLLDERGKWLQERKSGIGGSDVAAVLGLSKHKTAYDVYREKRGELAPEDLSKNERVTWGTKLEAVIAEEYAARTGKTVHRVNRIWRHQQYPFMLGSLDRRIVGENRGVEIKTVDKDAERFGEEWGDDGTDQVPTPYLLQVQHYCAVTGYDGFDVPVLVGGNDLRIYKIERDNELIGSLVRIEKDFWNCVLTGNPPTPRTLNEAFQRFPKSLSTPIDATAEILATVDEYRKAKAVVKRWDEVAEQYQIEIANFLGACDTLESYGMPVLTYKTQTAKRIDVGRLRAEMPTVAATYVTTSDSRVMRLKEVKSHE